MNQLAALFAGGAISGLVGVIVALVQQSLTRKTALKQSHRELFGKFMAASWTATIRVSQLAYTTIEKKESLRASEMHQSAIDNFNNVVAQIELVADQNLVVLAIRVDDELKSLWRDASSSQYERDNWKPRLQRVDSTVQSFLLAARSQLGSPKLKTPLDGAPEGSILGPSSSQR